jgi:hypothetical protein
VPNDSQFQAIFAVATTSKASMARYYLRVLGNQARGDSEPELIPNSNHEVVNLEHVLPQNPSAAWSFIDADTAHGYYNRLGNLALLTGKQNAQIGDLGFDEKRGSYEEFRFVLTRSLAEYTTWRPDQIDERQHQMADLAIVAWPIKL